MQVKEVQERSQRICDNMERVILGKREVMEYVLAAFLAGGHVLLEDVPGTGKTMLAKSLAASFGMSFKRVQFTPDLLPSDVTGIHYFNPKTSEFEFRPGGIFSNILLADEINRATPRTQSSLLEFVIATQNPVETSGTFPLPEAQLDRFMMKLSMGYPAEKSELELLRRVVDEGDLLAELSPVCTHEEFIQMQKACGQVRVHDLILGYVLEIAKKSRENKNLALGISSRGAIALVRAARCYAAVTGSEFVTPDMIKKLALMVLPHRILPADSYMSGKEPADYIREILGAVAAPTEEAFRA